MTAKRRGKPRDADGTHKKATGEIEEEEERESERGSQSTDQPTLLEGEFSADRETLESRAVKNL